MRIFYYICHRIKHLNKTDMCYIYKPGDIFEDQFIGRVKCVEDRGCGCNKCAFSEDMGSGASCSPRCYDEHPCYHSDRGDNLDVRFEKI